MRCHMSNFYRSQNNKHNKIGRKLLLIFSQSELLLSFTTFKPFTLLPRLNAPPPWINSHGPLFKRTVFPISHLQEPNEKYHIILTEVELLSLFIVYKIYFVIFWPKRVIQGDSCVSPKSLFFKPKTLNVHFFELVYNIEFELVSQ